MHLIFLPQPTNFMDLIYQYLLSFLLTFLAYKLYKKLSYRLPPGPRPWPVLGNLYHIKPGTLRNFIESAREYGPIISVWFGSSLNVIVSNSELAREVFKENDQQLADRDRSRLTAKFTKDGKEDLLWSDYGPHYVKLKHVCTVELFSPKRLEALRHIREDEVTAMVESIFKDCTNPENKGKSLVLKRYLEAMAFNNITRLVFGKRFENDDGVLDEQGMKFKAILTNGPKVDEYRATVEHIPWLRWLFPVDKRTIAKHGATRDTLTNKIMEEHRLARRKSGEPLKQHFVDSLVTLQDEYDLNDEITSGLLWDMIIMGMDTIAISVEWAMAELMKNSRLQKKAQDELDRVIGSDRIMTEWDFSNLPYLRCIVKETLRLHPPTPFLIPHKANTHVKIGGYDIPKGSTIHVNVWAIARDPTIWKNPLEFWPERFMEDDVDLKGHDFRLLPFGAGRRVCPATQLAFNLVTSMLGHLLHHFSWAPADGLMPEDIDMVQKMGLVAEMRTELQAFAIPRLKNHLYKRYHMDV